MKAQVLEHGVTLQVGKTDAHRLTAQSGQHRGAMASAQVFGGEALQRSGHLVARQADAGIGQGAINHHLFGGLGEGMEGQDSGKTAKQKGAQFHQFT